MKKSSEDVPVDPTVDPDIKPPEPVKTVKREEDRTIVGQLVEVEEEEEPEAPTLTNQERQDFAMLMTVGRRRRTINVMDHQVDIQTLKSADEMRIGLHTKPYLESQGFQRAYQLGVCAAGIVEIKNQPLWKSLREITDPEEIFAKNVEALSDFYPIVIAQIYSEIMKLEREFADLAIKLGKYSG